MIYNKPHNFLFIHVQRTGGTSIMSGFRHLDLYLRELGNQHENAKTVATDFFEQYEDVYKFGFVRNPWARIFSWYNHLTRKGGEATDEVIKDFNEFVETFHDYCASEASGFYFNFNQLDHFPRKANGEPAVDKIGQFENLHEDLSNILMHIGIPKLPLLDVNKAPTASYRDFYTDKTKQLVANACAEDIEYFGYKF